MGFIDITILGEASPMRQVEEMFSFKSDEKAFWKKQPKENIWEPFFHNAITALEYAWFSYISFVLDVDMLAMPKHVGICFDLEKAQAEFEKLSDSHNRRKEEGIWPDFRKRLTPGKETGTYDLENMPLPVSIMFFFVCL